MATRTISTKFAVEGESQYRSSVSNINREIKTLQSSLKLTQSQFKDNANSMAALTAKGQALQKLFDTQRKKVDQLKNALENCEKAEKKYADQKKELESKIDANNKALEKLKNTTGDTADEQKKLTAENRSLSEQLTKCDANLDAAQKGVENWKTQLNNAEIKLNDLDEEIQENSKHMQEAEHSADGCATSIDEFGRDAQKSAGEANQLAQALGAAGVAGAFKETVEALTSCAKASVEYESAVAGVAKTTDLTAEELQEMEQAIKDLSTSMPATATEIAGVVESAGQLGIAKQDLLDFAEVMINLGVSTNLSAEEAASSLAKFANVVNMSEKDYGRLGSTIVDLGNNFATTEADIVAMATRLASSGAVIGLSEAEIMAVAAALSSVGIEAEAGGSSVSKLFKKFETMVKTGSPALQRFAAVAGMSAKDFSKAWGENAVQALALFLDGLGEIDKSGGSAVAVLEDLEISDVRMSNAVLALAKSNGVLNKALQTANTAWEENTALAKEAATRYETTESKLQMLENAANNVKISIGDQLTPAVRDMVDVGTDALQWLDGFIQKNDGVVPTVTAAGAALGVLTVAVTGYTVATNIAIPAVHAFTSALVSNPVGAIALAVTAAGAAILTFAATIREDALPEVTQLNESVKNMKTTFESSDTEMEETRASIEGTAELARTYVERLKELESQTTRTEAEQAEYRMTVDKLASIIPELNLELDEQTGILRDGVGPLEEQIDAWEALGVQQALQKKYTEDIKAYAEAEADVYTAKAKLKTLQEEEEDLQERYNQLLREGQELNQQAAESYSNTAGSVEQQAAAMAELQNKQTDLADRMKVTSDEIERNEQKQNKLTETIQAASETLEGHNETIQEAKDAIDLYNEAIQQDTDLIGANTEVQAANQEAVKEITDKIQNLAQSYKDAYDDAYGSISGQAGLFEEYAEKISKSTDTVGEMMDIWAKQTETLGKYTENLQKAAQYGLDDGLILSLATGTPEAAGHLSTIIDAIEDLGGSTEGMSDKADSFVDDFNASFKKTEEAKESFATTVAGIKTDFSGMCEDLEQQATDINFEGFNDAMEMAFDDVGLRFEKIGKTVVSSIATGVTTSESEVSAAAGQMAQSADDTVTEKWSNASEHGEQFVQDIADGTESAAPALVEQVEQTADQVNQTATETAKSTSDSIISEFDRLVSETNAKMQALKRAVSETLSDMPSSAQNIGAQTVDGMIAGMNNRSSALYSTVRSIVDNAIKEAKSAAATASPSKKTTKIFEDVGEGMVVGLEHKRERVGKTAKSVVNDALDLDVGSQIRKAMASIDDVMPPLRRSGDFSKSVSNHYEMDVHLDHVTIREDADIDRIAEALHRKIQNEVRGRGGRI